MSPVSFRSPTPSRSRLRSHRRPTISCMLFLFASFSILWCDDVANGREHRVHRDNAREAAPRAAVDAHLSPERRSATVQPQSQPRPQPHPAAPKKERTVIADTTLQIFSRVRDSIIAVDGLAGILDGRSFTSAGSKATSMLRGIIVRSQPGRAALAAPGAPPRPPPRERPKKQRSVEKWTQTLYMQRNHPLLIECDLPSHTDDIVWTKDNKGAYEVGVDVLVSGHRVTAPYARTEHAGMWICSDRSNQQNEAIFNVLVLDAPLSIYLELDGRRLDAGNTWLPATEGHRLNISCITEGDVGFDTDSTLLWTLETSEGVEDTAAITVENDGRSASVAVIRSHHNATLACMSNASRRVPARAAVTLDVSYPPAFVLSREPGWGTQVVEGQPAVLLCVTQSRPPSTPRWLKDDGPPPFEQTGPTLYFPKVKRQHAGWYRCEADYLGHTYGSIGYFFTIAPAVEGAFEDTGNIINTTGDAHSQSSGVVRVELGGSLQLHCPKGSVGCWSRLQSNNITRSTTGRISTDDGGQKRADVVVEDLWKPAGSEHAHGVLGLKQAIYQDNGEYRCVGASKEAPNHIKELRRLTLAVKGGPTIQPLPTDATEKCSKWPMLACALSGDRVALSAEVCGDPTPQLIWIVAERYVLKPGDTFNRLNLYADPTKNISDSVCSVSTLHVGSPEEGVTPFHTGLYRLMALGSDTASAHYSWSLRVNQPQPVAARARAAHVHFTPLDILLPLLLILYFSRLYIK